MMGVTEVARLWRAAPVDQRVARDLAEALALPLPVAQVLVARGVVDPGQAHAFLNPSLEQLHDPYRLHGMERAVERIQAAIARGEELLVYGDYDADGVCATALLLTVLQSCGARAQAYIPHRLDEGYGLHSEVLEEAAAAGVTLIITVDTGITAVDANRTARRLGIDLIITDHHQLPPQLPEAFAVIHPRHPSGDYPFTDLCGTGVAFKLAQALLERQGRGSDAWQLLDLVALATVADVVPLRDENRVFAHQGLERLRRSPRPGLAALCAVAGVEPAALTAWHLAFVLAPRLNAAGRMGEATLALDLLLAEGVAAARDRALQLESENRARQREQARILDEARRRIAGDDAPVVVVSDPTWHAGVVGIVAARLVAETGRPVLLAAVREGVAQGSARSVPGFPITRCLERCADLLEAYGGHDQAAGFRVPVDALGALKARLCHLYEEYAAQIRPPAAVYDAELRLEAIDENLVMQLERLEPFGEGNPEPCFLLREVPVREARAVGTQADHLRLRLGEPGSTTWDAIAFGLGDRAKMLPPGSRADLLVSLRRGSWQGRPRLELHVSDLRPALTAGQALAYRHFLADVYRHLRRVLALSGRRRLPLERVRRGLTASGALTADHVEQALSIFCELDLARVVNGELELPPPAGKVDLYDSPTYRQLLEGRGVLPGSGKEL